MLDLDVMYGYKLAPLLDAGIPVLIYSGDKDWICNWKGGQAWINALDWSGQHGFTKQKLESWVTISGTKGGEVQRYKNLSFLRIYDAGHMVPMN